AIIIFSSQIKDILGLTTGEVPADFLEKWGVYIQAVASVNLYSLLLAAGTVLIVLFTPKVLPRVPGALLAIILATAVVAIFSIPVDTIGSRFGSIPNSFPLPKIPDVDFATFKDLLQPAIAIALLGGIESLLSAVVADGMIGGKHRSNMELVAQGGANIASALFGGIPATGAIARTATNIKSGGRTPIAGLVHAGVLLLIMLAAAPLARLIPLAALGGILVVVAYNMGEWRSFFSVLRSNRYDRIILLTTFCLTLLFDLIVAIEVGIVLSSFIFMKRMSDLAHIGVVETDGDQDSNGDHTFEEELSAIPDGVVIYEIEGPLFFGASQKFQQTMNDIQEHINVIILRLRHVPMIDATGMFRLREVVKSYRKQQTGVILSGVSPSIRSELLKAHVIEEGYICSDIQSSLELANTIRAKQIAGNDSP
ncbi:MAG: SulP family inorganic anion transporter, partial [Candidatus Kapaibacterium sp.]